MTNGRRVLGPQLICMIENYIEGLDDDLDGITGDRWRELQGLRHVLTLGADKLTSEHGSPPGGWSRSDEYRVSVG